MGSITFQFKMYIRILKIISQMTYALIGELFKNCDIKSLTNTEG